MKTNTHFKDHYTSESFFLSLWFSSFLFPVFRGCDKISSGKVLCKNVTVNPILLSSNFIFFHSVSLNSLINTTPGLYPLALVCHGNQSSQWRSYKSISLLAYCLVQLGIGVWYQPDPRAVESKGVLISIKSLCSSICSVSLGIDIIMTIRLALSHG